MLSWQMDIHVTPAQRSVWKPGEEEVWHHQILHTFSGWPWRWQKGRQSVCEPLIHPQIKKSNMGFKRSNLGVHLFCRVEIEASVSSATQAWYRVWWSDWAPTSKLSKARGRTLATSCTTMTSHAGLGELAPFSRIPHKNIIYTRLDNNAVSLAHLTYPLRSDCLTRLPTLYLFFLFRLERLLHKSWHLCRQPL